ncbi:hypothetical protein [Algivirga pacifica]|uniref:DUF4377 domain-containing protein n=1 Tax=Algivirga pacifica TaxID=1162670 RepID=A0ABP9DGC3_9BACT
MKKIWYAILAVWAVSFSACEQNDPLGELGEMQGFAPNIYMSPFQPAATAGRETETTIDYWIVGAKNYEGFYLWWQATTTEQYLFKIPSVNFSFSREIETEVVPYEVHAQYSFSENDFKLDSKTYQKTVALDIPSTFRSVNKQSKTTIIEGVIVESIATFAASLDAEVKAMFIEELVSTLTDAGHEKLLVTELEQTTAEQLAAQYDAEGNLTDAGKEWLSTMYSAIPLEDLLGEYQYKKVHVVLSKCEAKSGSGVSNFSLESRITIK